MRTLAPVRLAVIVAGLLCASSLPLAAEWLRYPTAGLPRMRDGKPNLAAPTPRIRDGKPDLSGMWLTGTGLPCDEKAGQDFLDCGVELPLSREGVNMGASLPGGLPYQPWAADLVRRRIRDQAKDDPHARCLPDTFLRAYGLPHIQKSFRSPAFW